MPTMKYETNLRVGHTFTNSDIVAEFKCGNMGGMRRSKATNSLIIISDNTKGLYEDKWYGDVLHYTGMGKIGDQKIDFAQNKTLAESESNGVTVHLFEVLVSTEYIYHGEVVLADKPYQEIQKGDDNELRYVWIFPLKLHDGTRPLSQEILTKRLRDKERAAQKLPLEELKKHAELNGSDKVSSRRVTNDVYIRDPFVAEYAKRRANGVCQLCGEEAPFRNTEGFPYLECHHIDWISNGGSDSIGNTVALCPNCHRKMHILDLPADRTHLIVKAQE